MSTVVICEWDQFICPICAEEMDGSDISVFPCPCEYQICLWCLKRIREDSAKCPLCRRLYDDQTMVKLNPPNRLIRRPKPITPAPNGPSTQSTAEQPSEAKLSGGATAAADHHPLNVVPTAADPPKHADRGGGAAPAPSKKGWSTHHPVVEPLPADGDDAVFPSLAATVPKLDPPPAPAPRAAAVAAPPEPAHAKGHASRKPENPFQAMCATQTKHKVVLIPPPPTLQPELPAAKEPELTPAPECVVKPAPASLVKQQEEPDPPPSMPCIQHTLSEDLAPPPGFDQPPPAISIPPPPGISAPPLQAYAPPTVEPPPPYRRQPYDHMYTAGQPPFGYGGGGSSEVEYYKALRAEKTGEESRYQRSYGGGLVPEKCMVAGGQQMIPPRRELPVYPPPFRPAPPPGTKDVLKDDGDLFGWDAYDESGTQWLDGLLNMHLGYNRYNAPVSERAGRGERFPRQLMQQSSFVSSTDFEWQRKETTTEQIVHRLLGQHHPHHQPQHPRAHHQQQPLHANLHATWGHAPGMSVQQPPGVALGNAPPPPPPPPPPLLQQSNNLVPGLTGGSCIEHVNGRISIDILRSVIPNAKISILEPGQRMR